MNRDLRLHISMKKNLVWALTYVNGQEVKAHGDTDQTAYWAIQNHVNTILNFRL